MLNKLLKRCMPWMNKGRWYSIRVVGSNITNLRTVFNSDEILSAVISSSGTPLMTVTTKHIPHIIDYKFCPEHNFGFLMTPPSQIDVYNERTFAVNVTGPGTYWFFMQMNEVHADE